MPLRVIRNGVAVEAAALGCLASLSSEQAANVLYLVTGIFLTQTPTLLQTLSDLIVTADGMGSQKDAHGN